MFLRRAFYAQVLDHCSLDCVISFGTVFTKRQTHVESGVFIGLYAVIGSAWLERECLIGSRCSLVSGPLLHDRTADGKWGPTDLSRMIQVRVGEGAWIGEGAIVMADVGCGSMVSAGAVVSTAVPADTLVAGNPARFVSRLAHGASESPECRAAS